MRLAVFDFLFEFVLYIVKGSDINGFYFKSKESK